MRVFSCLSAILVASVAAAGSSNFTAHYREYFYVGQTYIAQGNSSIMYGEIYVEHLTPAAGVTQTYPLVFLHGAGMTGTNFLNTPDGRPGWADWFMSQGYEVYIVDQPSRGRSPWREGIDGPQVSVDTYTVESEFTASQVYKLWPNATLHTQWPGNGTHGDPIYDRFFASMVPLLTDPAETGAKVQHGMVSLVDTIGRPIILLTHSQSGLFGWPVADARPEMVKAIITIEPGGPPFIGDIFSPDVPAHPYGLTEIPMTFYPPIKSACDLKTVNVSGLPGYTCIQQKPPARIWPNLLHIPVLTVTSESSWHGIFDDCTVRFLRDAGVKVDFIRLQDEGIHGNGHMMFMEMNNLVIVEKVLATWINKLDL